MNSLLGAVSKLAQAGSVVGKRDYALLLFYFLTGLRRSEVIGLRGKDLEIKEGTFVIKYRRKGGKFTAREGEPHVAELAPRDGFPYLSGLAARAERILPAL
jgi:integrase